MLERVVEQQHPALLPPAGRLRADAQRAVALGHQQREVRAQPPVGGPAVRLEARARPQQREVCGAEGAGGALAPQPAEVASEQRGGARGAGGGG